MITKRVRTDYDPESDTLTITRLVLNRDGSWTETQEVVCWYMQTMRLERIMKREATAEHALPENLRQKGLM